MDNHPLQSALDTAILMHRDVHFGGSFKMMLQYYESGGKGICQDFEIEQIRKLAEFEIESEQNLAPMLLNGIDAEKVAEAKKAYQDLKDLFEKDNVLAKKVALLIFSEEEFPEKEIQSIVEEKERIVPSLLELLHSENFYNPLFPGYGQAPRLAAKALGKIGDKRSIISLFESIGKGDFFLEDTLLEALKDIGEPAKNFLLQVLKSRPINKDNEKAAIAILTFKEETEIADTCFELLKELDLKKEISLSNYLILGCEKLENKEYRQDFLEILKHSGTPKSLILDMQVIVKKWN